MRLLVRLNLATAALLAASLVGYYFGKPFPGLLLFPTLAALAVLLLCDVVAVFLGWRERRHRALIPLVSGLLVVPLGFVAGILATEVVLLFRGAPHRPDTFVSGERRETLTRLAQGLMGHGFSEIRADSEPPAVKMAAGRAQATVPEPLLSALRREHLEWAVVDDERGLVVLSSYLNRTWHRYVYSMRPLEPLGQGEIRDALADVALRASSRPLGQGWYFVTE